MDEIRKAIKSGNLNGLYLFMGEEVFLRDMYVKSFITACVTGDFKDMNITEIEGGNVTIAAIENAVDTMPFMSEKRLLLVKDSKLFTVGKSNESERLALFIKEVYKSDSDTVTLFVESDVDKRGKAYKAAKKFGHITEFQALKESALITWIGGQLKICGISISTRCITYLLRTCGVNMENLSSEIMKLAAYKSPEEGEACSVTEADIDAICTKTAESRIFDIVDAVLKKDSGKALEIYQDLLSAKETPIGILALIASRIRLILRCKLMIESRASEAVIAQTLKQHTYAVKIAVSQARNIGIDTLKYAVSYCAELDSKIKTGRINDKLGVEILLITLIALPSNT